MPLLQRRAPINNAQLGPWAAADVDGHRSALGPAVVLLIGRWGCHQVPRVIVACQGRAGSSFSLTSLLCCKMLLEGLPAGWVGVAGKTRSNVHTA